MSERLRNEKGIAMIMVVIAMVVIIGFAALAVDFGNAAVRKSRLQNACDAAALAGAQALTDTDAAKDIAKKIFEKNIQSNMNNATIEDPDISFPDVGTIKNHKIVVSAHEDFPTYFAGIFGMDQMAVNTKAAAIFGSPDRLPGLRPFGIDENAWTSYTALAGGGTMPITLELDSGDGISGNYYLVTLDKTGKDEVNDIFRHVNPVPKLYMTR